MSHTVTVKLEMKDKEALQDAVSRMEGAKFVKARHTSGRAVFEQVNSLEEAYGKHSIFSGQFDGVAIQLPGWHYPVVINTETGEAKYDNYNGRWGEQDGLDELAQTYALEKAKTEALLHGLTVAEEQLEDGEVRLTINDYREI